MEPIADHADHGRYQERGVLVVRMDHDDDVGLLFEGDPVAALLVAPVTGVLLVDVDDGALERAGDRDGPVPAPVIDQDDPIDHPLGEHLGMGAFKRPLRVVGGHDHHDLLVLIHRKIVNAEIHSVNRRKGNRKVVAGTHWVSHPCVSPPMDNKSYTFGL